MSDLLKRLESPLQVIVTPDGTSHAAATVFNLPIQDIQIEAAARIRDLEASGAFAAGIEAALAEVSAMNKKWGNPNGTPEEQGANDMANRIYGKIKALSPSPGMVMVPAEPTREMCEAPDGLPAIHAINDLPLAKAGWSGKAIQNLKRYRAMIEAATDSKE